MAISKGLGKGLSALLGDEIFDEKSTNEIDIYEISPNPEQPRHYFDEEALTELAENIKENGVITPITLRKVDKGYEIIAGERRWRAARKAGLKTIPAIVLDIDEKKAYQLSMVENLQREDLSPIEEAQGFKKLMEEYNMTQDEVANAVSKSRPAVANAVRLLELPQEILTMVESGKLSAGHGRTLLPVKDREEVVDIAHEIVEKELSVRQVEAMVKRILESGEKPEQPSRNLEKMYVEQVEKKLAEAIGRNVSITNGKRKGKLYIEFYGNDDLESLINQLTRIKH
ncbi:MAG: ParB/RepB/Spo0J family partition protein [Clostridia bacterium]|nr:ParB/RepB/Spo0J family partition protein [Clostridia bacterium]